MSEHNSDYARACANIKEKQKANKVNQMKNSHEKKEKKPKRTWQEEVFTFKHCAVPGCPATSDRFKGKFS